LTLGNSAAHKHIKHACPKDTPPKKGWIEIHVAIIPNDTHVSTYKYRGESLASQKHLICKGYVDKLIQQTKTVLAYISKE